MQEYELGLTYSGAASVPALHEVCRSVLNPDSLSFVAANAPWNVVHSFEARRLKLASRSLGIASRMLLEQLRKTGGIGCNRSLLQFLHSLALRMKHVLLLVACTAGRLGLDTLDIIRGHVLRHFQIGLSANILQTVGNVLIDEQISGEARSENRARENAIYPYALEPLYATVPGDQNVAADILRALTVSLPNDLSRLIFLATLRDNNSGHYFHPELVRRFSESVADRAMLACHRRIYKQVVALPIEDLTDQLDAYMATVRAPRKRLIESWTKLQAYRATIPIDIDPISAEIFFMKVDVAVAILGARLPDEVWV